MAESCITKMKALKVKTFPKYLKENIEVDIDNLELNGNVRVEDVKVENYEITEFTTNSCCFCSTDKGVETGRSCCSSCRLPLLLPLAAAAPAAGCCNSALLQQQAKKINQLIQTIV